MHTLIISGGKIDEPFSADYIKRHTFDRVIAADGGLNFCRKIGLLPDLVLGDFDSVSYDILEYYRKEIPERINKFPAEKDETDTELAMLEAISGGSRMITVLGATGTRLDHVFGNIHLLREALEEGVAMYLVDAHNRIRMLSNESPFVLKRTEQFGKYVSLIPFTPTVEGLTLKGFAYDVTDFTLNAGKSRGISNELKMEQGKIVFKEGILLMIESQD